MTYDSTHNLFFLKVVWRGHHGVASAEGAIFSTGEESVSDKRESDNL